MYTIAISYCQACLLSRSISLLAVPFASATTQPRSVGGRGKQRVLEDVIVRMQQGAPDGTIRKELQDRNYAPPRISQLVGQARIKREQALGAHGKVVHKERMETEPGVCATSSSSKAIKAEPKHEHQARRRHVKKKAADAQDPKRIKLERQGLKREIEL